MPQILGIDCYNKFGRRTYKERSYLIMYLIREFIMRAPIPFVISL